MIPSQSQLPVSKAIKTLNAGLGLLTAYMEQTSLYTRSEIDKVKFKINVHINVNSLDCLL